MRRFLFVALALLFALPALATSTVSGNFADASGTAVSGTNKVRYELMNCGSNNPAVGAVTLTMAPVDILVASNGTFSKTMYANDEITCGGQATTYYHQSFLHNGVITGAQRDVLLYAGSNFNPANAPTCVANVAISCYLVTTPAPSLPAIPTSLQGFPTGVLSGDMAVYDGMSWSRQTKNAVDLRDIAGYNTDICAAINAAQTQFGTSPAGGEISIPRGTYNCGVTAVFDNIKGCNVHGVGEGSEGHAGTIIKWTGASGGRVLDIRGNVRGCKFHDFQIDGNGLASNCLDFRGSAGQTTDHNDTHDISIWNCTGPSAIGLHVGDTTNPDLSANTFSRIHVFYDSGTMSAELQQDGGQTVTNTYSNLHFGYTGTASRPTYMGHFVKGDAKIYFLNTQGPATTANIAVEDTFDWFTVYGGYHEISTGVSTEAPVYLFPYTATARRWNTKLDSVRILWTPTDPTNKIIDYRHDGPLTITDGAIDNNGSGFGVVYFTNTFGGSNPAKMLWRNNPVFPNSGSTIYISTGSGVVIDGDNTVGSVNNSLFPTGSFLWSDTARQASILLWDPDPRVTLCNSGAAADEKCWDFLATTAAFKLRAINDPRNAATEVLTVNRGTGTAVTNAEFHVPILADVGVSGGGGAAYVFRVANGGAGVSTGSVLASSYADVIVPWAESWTNTGYQPFCSIYEANSGDGIRFIRVKDITNSQMTVVVHNDDAGGAHTGIISCAAGDTTP